MPLKVKWYSSSWAHGIRLEGTGWHLPRDHTLYTTYLPPDTSEHTPLYPQPDRLVLDLPNPERWKAELTEVVEIVYLLVTIPSSNRTRCRPISLIETNALTTTSSCHQMEERGSKFGLWSCRICKFNKLFGASGCIWRRTNNTSTRPTITWVTSHALLYECWYNACTTACQSVNGFHCQLKNYVHNCKSVIINYQLQLTDVRTVIVAGLTVADRQFFRNVISAVWPRVALTFIENQLFTVMVVDANR